MIDLKDYDYLKVLFALAWADQKIQHEEMSFLDQVIGTMSISAQESKEIECMKSSPVSLKDLQDINFSKHSLDQRKFLLLLAYGIARADGIVTSEEVDFLEELQSLLSLTNTTYEDLIEEIEYDLKLYGIPNGKDIDGSTNEGEH